MKIAAYLDAQDRLATFPEGVGFRLFALESGHWVPERDVPLDADVSMGLTELTARANAAIRALGDCRVALLGDLRGLLRLLLEEAGWRTWKSAGTMTEQLDSVAAHEAEIAAQPVELPVEGVPQAVGDPQAGHYFLDLVEVLRAEPHPASRDVLLPFMQAAPFRLLEIRCDHLPRWFEGAAKHFGLDYSYSPEDADGIFTISVSLAPEKLGADRSLLAYASCRDHCRSHGCSGC